MANKKKPEEALPVLEIKPSEEYHPRPMWQRIGAWILIVLIVAATGIIALWGR
jgi:hypothetical protein